MPSKLDRMRAKQQEIAGKLLQTPKSLDVLRERLQSDDLVPHPTAEPQEPAKKPKRDEK